MKKLICLFAALVLAGCQSHNGRVDKKSFKFPTASEIKSQCESQIPAQAASRDIHVWLCQSVSAIQYRFFDADLYKGKICDLVITQPLGQQPTGVKAVGGDPTLCLAAIEATKQAIDSDTFPMRPSSMRDEIPVHFAP